MIRIRFGNLEIKLDDLGLIYTYIIALGIIALVGIVIIGIYS